jgi:hypothetical protein
MALSDLSSARYPMIRYGLEGMSVYLESCPLYNMAPHCCPYQSGARIPARLYTVAIWKPHPGSLDR